MDQLTAMRAFVAVAQHCNFSAAGRELGMSRARVSRLIQQLEAQLGVSLLQRSTRDVSLTDNGLCYLAPCSACVEQARLAQQALQQNSDQLSGPLRVQAPTSFASEWLADALARFGLQHPDLQISLHVDDKLLDPIRHGFDLSIRVGGVPDSSGLQMRRLAPCHGLLCASPAYLKQHGMPQHPKDLQQHRCLHFSHLTDGRHWQFEQGASRLSVEVPVSFSSNNGKVLHQAALCGAGIAYSTSFLAWQDLLAGRLVSVLGDWQLPLNDFTALYPASRRISPKVRALIDFLIVEYQPETPWDRALRTHKG